MTQPSASATGASRGRVRSFLARAWGCVLRWRPSGDPRSGACFSAWLQGGSNLTSDRRRSSDRHPWALGASLHSIGSPETGTPEHAIAQEPSGVLAERRGGARAADSHGKDNGA
jgi:hypothetical protein